MAAASHSGRLGRDIGVSSGLFIPTLLLGALDGLALNTTPTITVKPRATKTVPRPTTALRVSPRTINGLAQVFKLLSDESRLKILLALAQDRELHVSAL